MVLGLFTRGFAAAALLALAGCAAGGTVPDAAGGSAIGPMNLAGTSWQLVEFQSMDDAQGTRRPASDRTVTATFAEDGKLVLKLDCNRGTATWSAGPHHATGSGLAIGPVASTRAMCPEPSMGGFVARTLPDVASYVLRDGKLYLALKMDGGIFEFAPIAP
ncbi:META domain-containing protein [Novosphingobium aquimarinum]|uniref:META domain-containing protein n=1 Tax=Novosphingobium aquimarinum TaxID=2682494 RepID=UPI0018DBD241|nr:META domain-containing protein [Novosphingobium aquimarinum]